MKQPQALKLLISSTFSAQLFSSTLDFWASFYCPSQYFATSDVNGKFSVKDKKRLTKAKIH